MIPESVRFPGEGNSYALQKIAQRIPRTEELGGLHSLWGHKQSDTTEQLTLLECKIKVQFILTV